METQMELVGPYASVGRCPNVRLVFTMSRAQAHWPEPEPSSTVLAPPKQERNHNLGHGGSVWARRRHLSGNVWH